ncbi:MAG: CRISPR-associated endonuclease Cas2 [Bifidobacteriaceae bacterium]|nr:CRISPR-associated endonuclease Cas2 [Bifidobacteriaceae bacterium]
MMVLVTYDVNTEESSGKKRLRRVAKACMKYGQRVQNSVFECAVDSAQYVVLKHDLLGIIDTERDSLRFYHLGKNYAQHIEHFGLQHELPADGLMML